MNQREKETLILYINTIIYLNFIFMSMFHLFNYVFILFGCLNLDVDVMDVYSLGIDAVYYYILLR